MDNNPRPIGPEVLNFYLETFHSRIEIKMFYSLQNIGYAQNIIFNACSKIWAKFKKSPKIFCNALFQLWLPCKSILG